MNECGLGPRCIQRDSVPASCCEGKCLASSAENSAQPCPAGYCRYDCQRDPAIWVPRLQLGEAFLGRTPTINRGNKSSHSVRLRQPTATLSCDPPPAQLPIPAGPLRRSCTQAHPAPPTPPPLCAGGLFRLIDYSALPHSLSLPASAFLDSLDSRAALRSALGTAGRRGFHARMQRLVGAHFRTGAAHSPAAEAAAVEAGVRGGRAAAREEKWLSGCGGGNSGHTAGGQMGHTACLGAACSSVHHAHRRHSSKWLRASAAVCQPVGTLPPSRACVRFHDFPHPHPSPLGTPRTPPHRADNCTHPVSAANGASQPSHKSLLAGPCCRGGAACPGRQPGTPRSARAGASLPLLRKPSGTGLSGPAATSPPFMLGPFGRS